MAPGARHAARRRRRGRADRRTTFAVALGSPFWATAVTVMASHSASVLLVAPLGMDVAGPLPSTRPARADRPAGARARRAAGRLRARPAAAAGLPADPAAHVGRDAAAGALRDRRAAAGRRGDVGADQRWGTGRSPTSWCRTGCGPRRSARSCRPTWSASPWWCCRSPSPGPQRREALGPRGRRRGALPPRLQRLADRDDAAAASRGRPGRRRGERRRRGAARLRGRRAARPAVGQRARCRRTGCGWTRPAPRSCAGALHGWVREVRLGQGRRALGPAGGLRAREARRRADAQRPAGRPERERLAQEVPRGRAGLHRGRRGHHQHPDRRASTGSASVVRFNPAAEAVSGLPVSAEVLGTLVWDDASGPARRPAARAGWGPTGPACRGPASRQMEDEWVLPSGERRTVDLVVRRPRSGPGRLATW